MTGDRATHARLARRRHPLLHAPNDVMGDRTAEACEPAVWQLVGVDDRCRGLSIRQSRRQGIEQIASATSNRSGGSSIVSSMMAMATDLEVSPGAKVSVADPAV